jgi:diaminohydroxyphosphoribosylaminopyrimidine deaminase/5-amino-6-(5-phosphoribosylamino)uracil reductase
MGHDRDLRFMSLALSLGRRGWGRVWPNPAVGCVLTQGDRIVGRGWTQPGGRPHAETVALAQAGPLAAGATAYVTLEPCAHIGQTPPCAGALIEAGVARVVVALTDPDPRVAGRGLQQLKAAGVEVVEGIGAAAAGLDQRGFLSRITAGRPLLTLKLATSLDGRIATASGESQWITGPAARRQGHALRAAHDAVLVGAGTARADNPTLTVRDMGVSAQPVRVVASRNLDVPAPSRLTETVGEGPVWMLHGPTAPAARKDKLSALGVRLIEVPLGPDGQLDAVALMTALGSAGLTRVYCEGGGGLGAALLSAGVVDDLVVFGAGLALGAEGRPALGVMGIAALAEADRFDLVETRAMGGDTMTVWRKG